MVKLPLAPIAFAFHTARRVSLFELTLALLLLIGLQSKRQVFGAVDLSTAIFLGSLILGIPIMIWASHNRVLSLRTSKTPERLILAALVSVFILLVYALFSLMWTTSSNYAHSKAMDMMKFIVWPSIFAIISCNPKAIRIDRLLWMLAVAGLIVMLIALIQWVMGTPVPTVFGSTYFGVGRLTGIFVIVLTIYLLFINKLRGFALIELLWLFGVLVVFVSSSKTTLLSLCLTMSILFPLAWYGVGLKEPKRQVVRFLVYFAIVLFGFPIANSLLRDNPRFAYSTSARIVWESKHGSNSAHTRTTWYSKSLQHIRHNPLVGYGLGSWPTQLNLPDIKQYPYNLFIEIWFELGIIGLVVCGFIALVGCYPLLKPHLLTENMFLLATFSLFVYFLAISMLNGDINDNRSVFFFAIATLAQSARSL